MKLGNLLESPMHELSDRRILAQRVYDALIADRDAVLDFKGECHRYTWEEQGNWEAREHFAAVIQSYPKKATPAPTVQQYEESLASPVAEQGA